MSGEVEDPRNEVLIWSHYTKGHRGGRIILDSEFLEGRHRELRKMRYQKERLFVDVTLDFESHEFQSQLSDALAVKSLAWKYENESRLMVFPHGRVPGSDKASRHLEFIKLPPQGVIGIDVGIKMATNTRRALEKLLGDPDFSYVCLREAVCHQSEYRLDYQPMSS